MTFDELDQRVLPESTHDFGEEVTTCQWIRAGLVDVRLGQDPLLESMVAEVTEVGRDLLWRGERKADVADARQVGLPPVGPVSEKSASGCLSNDSYSTRIPAAPSRARDGLIFFGVAGSMLKPPPAI